MLPFQNKIKYTRDRIILGMHCTRTSSENYTS
jgi:hypothetical protein